jgi:hypothetical protein
MGNYQAILLQTFSEFFVDYVNYPKKLSTELSTGGYPISGDLSKQHAVRTVAYYATILGGIPCRVQ